MELTEFFFHKRKPGSPRGYYIGTRSLEGGFYPQHSVATINPPCLGVRLERNAVIQKQPLPRWWSEMFKFHVQKTE